MLLSAPVNATVTTRSLPKLLAKKDFSPSRSTETKSPISMSKPCHAMPAGKSVVPSYTFEMTVSERSSCFVLIVTAKSLPLSSVSLSEVKSLEESINTRV